MSYLRVRTIKNRKYLYRQTSVRRGKRVHTISEYLGALICIPIAAMSPGRPGGHSGYRSTDKRTLHHQEMGDRELYEKSRAAFNVKLRQEYEREHKGKVKVEPVETDKDRETMEAIREFNEARAAERTTSAENHAPGEPS